MGAWRDQSSGLSSVLLVALALLLPTTARPAGVELADLTYDRETGHLSAVIQAMPAGELLRHIAEAAGIRFRVRGVVGEVPAQRFGELPLDQAVRRLLGGGERALIMLYEDAGERLAEVRLSARSQVASRSSTATPAAPVALAEATPTAPARSTALLSPPPPPRIPPPPPPRRR